MSHLVTGKVAIKMTELAALERAVKHLGATLEQRHDFRWFGGKTRCDYVLTNGVPSAYEVGVIRTSSGTLEMKYDTYGSGAWIATSFGEHLERLEDRFLAEVCCDEFTSQGMSVEIHEDENGIVIDGLTYGE